MVSHRMCWIAFAVLALAACAHAPYDVASGGLAVTATETMCAEARTDVDQDGLDDGCELALAVAFAPELVVDTRDCLWQPDLEPPRLGGGYLFAAQRTPGEEAVRIAYLPAYYRDCGWSGGPCMFRGPDCSGHAGDSELMVIDVAPDGATRRWRTVGVFLSAHCFGGSAGRCRWYRDEDLGAFTWVDETRGGAPRVWVARGKHANYPSEGSCDRGNWFQDSCDENHAVVRFPVLSGNQNIGNRRAPLFGAGGCVAAAVLPLARAGASGTEPECFWDPAVPFWGWQSERSGDPPTPYARFLEDFAGF